MLLAAMCASERLQTRVKVAPREQAKVRKAMQKSKAGAIGQTLYIK